MLLLVRDKNVFYFLTDLKDFISIMSAVTLTKRLMSVDFINEEGKFFDILGLVLKEFIATRSPIFPRQVGLCIAWAVECFV